MAEIEASTPLVERNERSLETGRATRDEDPEFDSILEAAAPKIAEMARQAREMRRAGQTRKFPA